MLGINHSDNNRPIMFQKVVNLGKNGVAKVHSVAGKSDHSSRYCQVILTGKLGCKFEPENNSLVLNHLS